MNIYLLNENLKIFVQLSNGILTSLCQILALTIIAFGVIRALLIFLDETLLKKETSQAFQKSRLMMGYSFSLGLSFLIGATIMKTMISSQWDDLARLAVIILIRTTLNLLLERATKAGLPETSPAEKSITPSA
ncbi:MAG: DUF1622 domain-containing protein [Limnothrix sp.]